MDPSAVLSALAELAPVGQRRDRMLDGTGGRPLLWLAVPDWDSQSRPMERFAALDVLHRDERLVRRGWAFVLGTIEIDGASRTVRVPLLSEPVRVQRGRGGYRINSAGDLELTPMVEDRDLAARLEAVDKLGSSGWLADPDTADWLRKAAAAAGLPVDEVQLPTPDETRSATETAQWPPRHPLKGMVAVAGAALYVPREAFSGSVRDTLMHWSGRASLADTALAAVYGATGSGEPAPPGPDEPPPDLDEEVLSPLPLNAGQAEVVRRARTERVAVVSGPPGSGKSHAVVAAALDVVDRGGSVLLATQSTHAADVLGELLDRYPGPTPVLFGDAEHRERIAAELAAGAGTGYHEATLQADQEAVAAAGARVRQLSAAVEAALELECRAASLAQWEPLAPALRLDAPRAFAPDTDLSRAEALADRAEALADLVGTPTGSGGALAGWWRGRRWRRAGRRLRAALGAGPQVPMSQLRAAIKAARASQAAARLATTGGTELDATWQALHEAEAALAAAVGTAMRHRAGSAKRWGTAARANVAQLASALRAGRNRRRELLVGLDGAALVRALPLWVGTAADTGDLLPAVPGMFDLVILDEASHLDQLRAAPVLARARRALVVGDPRQLRFVSFVADVDVAVTLHRHQLNDRVDVRRVSAFDLAAGAAPVIWLDEHYRSVPHLIEFSAARFYSRSGWGGGRGLAVATRHPANESQDVIDIVRVTGASVTRGVNAAEVQATMTVVGDLADQGATDIAVVSPFRAQADALETALVNTYAVDELERLGLRVGTVHAFQGSEARTVVASLGLVDGDSPARARFVADPQLFNVLVTRARDRMVVVTSLTTADGIIGDYLAFSEGAPRPPEPAEPDDRWTAELATELRRTGQVVRCDYPVGHWRVDVCFGEAEAAVGLVTRVHPDGTAAHRHRQRSLARAGWRMVDAFPSRWDGDPVRAALDLTSAPLSSATPGTAGRRLP
jgi:hypothetical protein